MRTKAKVSNQTTCYVIAYDIPDDKRRTKIHKLLLGFGVWTQFSLFECFLTRKDLVLLRSKLAKHLIEAQDSVRFYPLCAQCLAKVETVGGPRPHEDSVFIV
ncbi:MAG: CRISPR-associated endonuclease Cas2 [Ktedonobacteraceae bacterium]|nr:CRISPR-associated endonuclease Cas2 [Ktedonobacteraceae bacterium]